MPVGRFCVIITPAVIVSEKPVFSDTEPDVLVTGSAMSNHPLFRKMERNSAVKNCRSARARPGLGNEDRRNRLKMHHSAIGICRLVIVHDIHDLPAELSSDFSALCVNGNLECTFIDHLTLHGITRRTCKVRVSVSQLNVSCERQRNRASIVGSHLNDRRQKPDKHIVEVVSANGSILNSGHYLRSVALIRQHEPRPAWSLLASTNKVCGFPELST